MISSTWSVADSSASAALLAVDEDIGDVVSYTLESVISGTSTIAGQFQMNYDGSAGCRSRF